VHRARGSSAWPECLVWGGGKKKKETEKGKKAGLVGGTWGGKKNPKYWAWAAIDVKKQIRHTAGLSIKKGRGGGMVCGNNVSKEKIRRPIGLV